MLYAASIWSTQVAERVPARNKGDQQITIISRHDTQYVSVA
jgi:hypothetical protein